MTQTINVVRLLGEGSFGVVLLIKRGEAKSQYAMKVFKSGELLDKREINVLKELHHPHIVQYRGLIVYDHKDAVLMEYCDGGDLKNYLDEQSEPLIETLVWEWFTQLSAAMAYFHARGTIHRDMKPANVLLVNGELKISDFGLASIMDKMVSKVTTSKQRGTALYMAPELFDEVAHFGPKSDIWGLGCIVYEMCTRKYAFSSIVAILNKDYEPIQGNYSSGLKKTVGRMLKKSPEDRINLTEILNLRQIQDNMTDALDSVDEASPSRPSTSNSNESEPVARSPPFPDPHSAEMRAKVANGNLRYWQGFDLGLVPFLCNENGEYFVDWNDIDIQWKFGDWGKNRWCSKYRVGCSLLLPHQFDSNGLNVNVWLGKCGESSLDVDMTHKYSPSANVPLTTFKCHIHVSIKHKDGESSTELQEEMSCRVKNSYWETVFTFGSVPFKLFSETVAPNMRLTLVPL